MCVSNSLALARSQVKQRAIELVTKLVRSPFVAGWLQTLTWVLSSIFSGMTCGHHQNHRGAAMCMRNQCVLQACFRLMLRNNTTVNWMFVLQSFGGLGPWSSCSHQTRGPVHREVESHERSPVALWSRVGLFFQMKGAR